MLLKVEKRQIAWMTQFKLVSVDALDKNIFTKRISFVFHIAST